MSEMLELRAAFDELEPEANDDGEATETILPLEDTLPEAVEDEISETPTTSEENLENKAPTEEAESTAAAGEDTPSVESKDSIKAPIDWNPKAREDWSKIPRHLQEQINTRETHMAKEMEGTKTAKSTHNAIAGMTQQYGQLMQAEGATNPIQAIDGMFKTVQTLRNGTQAEKARTLADMINHYGVDIGELDSTLVAAPEQDPVQTKLEQLLEQKMAPVNQLMQGLGAQQAQQAQAKQAQAVTAVQTFQQSAEFLPDVRNDMADLIDMAAARGVTMGLQEAYDKACSIHPDISKVVADRKQQERITGGNSRMAAKRDAASSLSGRRSGVGGGSSNLSLRDSLASAWDGA